MRTQITSKLEEKTLRRVLTFLVAFLLIVSVFLPVIKATAEREWMVIPPSYSEKYDNDGDVYDDSHKVQIDADTEHYDEVFTVHAKGRMYDRYDDTPLTPWVQVDWQISAPGGVNQLEWSPEMHFNVPDGYTPKEAYPYVRIRTLIYLYDDEWNLEQNGDYEYEPWEIRHNLYPPASNDPPVLSNGYVAPTSGNTSTLFHYYVQYSDPNGDSPTQRDVCIDGSEWHTMGLHNGSASDGYYRCILTLSEGEHNYFFKFSDGEYTVYDPPSGTYPDPTVSDNVPPVLSDGYVTPMKGDTLTLFYYYVRYYDPNGDAPTQRAVCIDESEWHTMTHHNGSASNGFYRCVLTLSAGTHNYFFKFSDGEYTVLLPPSGTYPGPTVSPTGHIELYYDDGNVDGEYATSTLPHFKAVRFHTPTARTYTLGYVKYYISSDPFSFELQIRDSSAQIVFSEVVTPTATGWFEVDLALSRIYVQDDFYVAMRYLSFQQPKLGADYNDPDLESGEGTSFPHPPNLISLDWMIRALVGIPGDLDTDGDVDSDDFALFAGAYGTSPPTNPNCDLDGDGDVDPDDFAIFAANYGRSL